MSVLSWLRKLYRPNRTAPLRRSRRRPLFDLLEDRTCPSGLTTNQADYAPGSTATLFATDFRAGETVQFNVVHTDTIYSNTYPLWLVADGDTTPAYTDASGNLHQPDLDGIVNGNIQTTWQVGNIPNSSLQATATGLTSGNVATTSFTDSITTPTSIGTALNKTAGTTITITTTAAVSVGNTIIVTVAMDPNAGSVAVADSAGNTYTSDADVTNGSVTSGVRTLVFSAPVTSNLASGGTITVTFGTSTTAKAVSALQVNGLLSVAKDLSSTGSAASTSVASGSVTTTQANELLIGAAGVEDKQNDLTSTGSFTAIGSVNTGVAGAGSANLILTPAYQIVSSTGSYNFTATIGSANWAAALVAYKADVAAPAGSVTSFSDGTQFLQATAPTSISGSVADATDGIGLNADTTTFTLQRGSDSFYWNGTSWQAGVFNLATTHTATTGGNSTTWTSTATLPDWTLESNGSYSVQVTATDRVGNTSTSTAISFTLGNDAPVATVTDPSDGSTLNAGTVPSSISGTIVDSDNGVNADSTTFTLQRGSDGFYWNGAAWQDTAFNLATTHSAAGAGSSVGWTSNVTLPFWALETETTYTIQATGTDTQSLSATGTAISFTLDNTSPTAVVDSITNIDPDSANSSDFITTASVVTVNGTFTGTLDAGENIQVSADGGATWVTATAGSGTWSASVTLNAGSGTLTTRTIDSTDNTTGGASQSYTSDSVAPTVTDGNISVWGASGTGGTYVIGDTVTVTWDSSASGDNNDDIDTATVDFSQFGGGSAVAAVNNSGVWTATYIIVAGSIEASNVNVSVTATDFAGNSTTTSDTSDVTVDNIGPTAAVDAITSISADTGTSGDFITATASQTVNGTFTGTLNGGENIQVSADNGVTWVNATVGSGTWSASVTLSTGAGTLKTRTIDGSGNALTGATHSYNLDQTNPTTGTVRDGSSTDIDTQVSLTTISANWSGFADPGSGITGYQWAIGTTPGGTDVQGYTSVGTSTSASNSSLGLTVGTTYYVSVKATDNAGNVSSASVSDGVEVVSAATKKVTIKGGNNQKNVVGTSFSKPLQVVVRNLSDNKLLAHKPVTFTIVTAGNGAGGYFKVGKLKKQSITVSTNKAGIAKAKHLFSNHIAGTFTITITIGAESSTTTFTETNKAGKPAHLAADSGGGQSTDVHTAFASPLQVTVTDAFGNTVSGAHVIFFTPGTKQAFFQVGLKQKTFVTVTTNSSGVATSPVPQAGGKAGTYKIVALLGKLHVGFTETNTL